jgi:hypothetical protein
VYKPAAKRPKFFDCYAHDGQNLSQHLKRGYRVKGSDWQPTKFLRYIETIGSSSRTAIVRTDAGLAYLKAINNPQSPHVLACDWIGTKLAWRFGLRTFDVAILELEDGDEIPLDQNTKAEIGPALVARGEKGEPLVSPSTLRFVQNINDIPRLIVFDTWVRKVPVGAGALPGG